jgi:hypothetical protein
VIIEARGAQTGGTSYWLRSLLPQFVWPGKTAAEDRDAPAVVCRSGTGEAHVLQRTGTYRQAEKAAARFRRELVTLGAATFCERYGLPPRLAE